MNVDVDLDVVLVADVVAVVVVVLDASRLPSRVNEHDYDSD